MAFQEADQDEFTVNSGSGIVTFKPLATPDYETKTSYSLIVSASDGTSITTQNLTININNLNDNAPTISVPTPITGTEFTNNTSGTIRVSDADGTTDDCAASGKETDCLNGSITDGGSSFTVSGSNAGIYQLIFKSYPDYEVKNSYSVAFTVSDGTYSATENLTVTITDVNEPPLFNVGQCCEWTVDENQTAIGTIGATDPEGHNPIYSISGSNIAVDSSTGVLTFTSAPDYETQTTYTATVTVTDDGPSTTLNPNTANITVNLNNVNDNAPVFIGSLVTYDAAFTIHNGDTRIWRVRASDADGDNMNVASRFSISGTDGNDFEIVTANGEIYVDLKTTADYATKALTL